MSEREVRMDKQLPKHGTQFFEEPKLSNEHGAEYWSARDLQPMLGYSQRRRFEDAVKRAMTSCETSGNNPGYHFSGADKMIPRGTKPSDIKEIKSITVISQRQIKWQRGKIIVSRYTSLIA